MYKHESVVSEFCNESRNAALQYRFAQAHLGKEYADLVIPCIPAVDLRIPVSEAGYEKTNDALLKVK